MIKSFHAAFKGIRHALRGRNFRVHIGIGIIVFGAGIMLGISRLDWMLIVLTIGVVLAAEAANTAVEELCDFVHQEHHAHIGIIKDTAAGAVLITAVAAFVIGLFIFIPHIAAILGG